MEITREEAIKKLIANGNWNEIRATIQVDALITLGLLKIFNNKQPEFQPTDVDASGKKTPACVIVDILRKIIPGVYIQFWEADKIIDELMKYNYKIVDTTKDIKS